MDESSVYFEHVNFEMLRRHPSGVSNMQINHKSGAKRRCLD